MVYVTILKFVGEGRNFKRHNSQIYSFLEFPFQTEVVFRTDTISILSDSAVVRIRNMRMDDTYYRWDNGV